MRASAPCSKRRWVCRFFRSRRCGWRWSPPASRRAKRTSSAALWVRGGSAASWRSFARSSSPAWRPMATPPSSASESSARSRASATMAFPSPTPPRSRCSSMSRPGSSAIIPVSSLPPSSTVSRWGSTRRHKLSPMRERTESRCGPSMSTPASGIARWKRFRRAGSVKRRASRVSGGRESRRTPSPRLRGRLAPPPYDSVFASSAASRKHMPRRSRRRASRKASPPSRILHSGHDCRGRPSNVSHGPAPLNRSV